MDVAYYCDLNASKRRVFITDVLLHLTWKYCYWCLCLFTSNENEFSSQTHNILKRKQHNVYGEQMNIFFSLRSAYTQIYICNVWTKQTENSCRAMEYCAEAKYSCHSVYTAFRLLQTDGLNPKESWDYKRIHSTMRRECGEVFTFWIVNE